MKIETYEIEETTTEGKDPVEVEAVALQLIEDLGLEGQKKLIVGGEDEEGEASVGTRIPYPKMKAEEVEVYSIVCDERSSLEDYSGQIIPLRVLQVASHARGLFDKVQVWAPEVHDPDPILVGWRRPPGQSYGDEFFLLARWGEELAPFEDLRDRAKKQLMEEWDRKCELHTAETKAFRSNLESKVLEKLSGTYVHTPF